MDIEKELKRKHPNLSNRQIRAMRIDAFEKAFKSQRNYWNWAKKEVTPSLDKLKLICKILDLDIKKIKL